MNKKTAVQPLSENTRKAIIIAAIVVVAVIILSVALALILRPSEKLPDDESSSSGGSSSLTIRNGDFAYTGSDDTAFPKTAQNWTRYGYKAKSTSSDTHDFASISTHEQAVMGIVDTEDWKAVQSDLSDEGLGTITNPGTNGRDDADDLTDSNVYMIATKEATAASILSDSFSVSSGTSVKITVLLNTNQLADGTNAVIMIQKSTVSALNKYWYAYDFQVAKTADNEWVTQTFHIFNRESSTQYIRISIGIGNVYSGEEGLDLVDNEPIKGSGVLFIDDIKYETVTANEYREVVDGTSESEITSVYHPFKIIENDEITDESTYLPLEGVDGVDVSTFETSDKYVKEATYSPFTERDDFRSAEELDGERFEIYKVSSDGSKQTVSLRLEAPLGMKSSPISKDHIHISFWVRVAQTNKVAKANIHVQTMENGEWEDLTNGSWKSIATSQDIKEDSNAGWIKYDIYLKPSSGQKEISLLFTLGDESAKKLNPKGSMYVTKPAYEIISYKDFNNASSGSYVKKFDLTGNSATVTVTNGSFSSLGNTGVQPSDWTPVFAGDNALYNDGLGNTIELNRSTKAVRGSGVVKQFTDGPTIDGGHLDDEQRNVLKIAINGDAPTSYGYVSSNFTLSSRTAYVISVLAKTASPYIYLLNNDSSKDRDNRVIASVEGAQNLTEDDLELLGETYTGSLGNGWTRYYIVVVTGNESQTVRLALFNGKLDGTEGSGEIYYDQVEVKTLDSYSLVDNNEDVDEDSDEQLYYDIEWSGHKFTDNTVTYGKDFGKLLEKLAEDETILSGVTVVQPTDDEWDEMKLIPAKDDDDKTPEDTTPADSDVDLGLLFSVISSVALVAALAVVLVVKLFRHRKSTPKAA